MNMSGFRLLSRATASLLSGFLLAGGSPSFAQQPSMASGPTPVQSSGKMVHTPAGDMPEECVHEVPSGSRILGDGLTVEFPDKTQHKFPPCTQTPAPSSSTMH
jgi:hypothetical protein